MLRIRFCWIRLQLNSGVSRTHRDLVSQGRGIVGFTSGEPRQDIACPGCGFAPFVGMQWSCSPDGCGGTFDTSATRARCPHCDAQFAWTIRRLSLPGHHPARLGLGAPQDATGAERCAVSVGPVDRMFATPPDSPGQCEPGLSDDRPRDPRLCYCPELSPRATRSSSS
jgi:hypothetical protein